MHRASLNNWMTLPTRPKALSQRIDRFWLVAASRHTPTCGREDEHRVYPTSIAVRIGTRRCSLDLKSDMGDPKVML